MDRAWSRLKLLAGRLTFSALMKDSSRGVYSWRCSHPNFLPALEALPESCSLEAVHNDQLNKKPISMKSTAQKAILVQRRKTIITQRNVFDLKPPPPASSPSQKAPPAPKNPASSTTTFSSSPTPLYTGASPPAKTPSPHHTLSSFPSPSPPQKPLSTTQSPCTQNYAASPHIPPSDSPPSDPQSSASCTLPNPPNSASSPHPKTKPATRI